MAIKVIMPQMGESIFEGTITKWLKKVGETVARDEPLFEISTDKVDSEIPSPAAGVLTEILVPEGQTVQINTVVAVIDGEPVRKDAAKEKVEAADEEPAPAQEPPPAPTEAEWRKAAPADSGRGRAGKPERPAAAPSAPSREIRTSPLVRRLAREHGVDLASIEGTGLGGRITKQDILSYIDSKTGAPAPLPAPPEEAPAPPSVPATEPAPSAAPERAAVALPGDGEAVPMTVMRKAIAEHMLASKRTSAHVHTVFEVDMTSIVQLREKHKSEFESRSGIKLTYTPFFVKALVDSVREFPVLNCSVVGDNIVYRRAVHVGVAVSLEDGLIVPVVKDAHLKSFTGIALAVQDLAERARSRKLKPDDVQNGTITVTNPGVYGSVFGTPIIHQPQVAILGVGGIEKRPVVVNDAIAIRSMAYLSLSFDHRVIDGAVADQFMASLKARLQAWSQWME